MMLKKGKLIVIDGTDGSGKATQTKKLIERIIDSGRETETLDFPQYHNNYFGHIVSAYLRGDFGDPAQILPYLSSIIYAADRFESSNKITKWLNDEKIIILDRYVSANQIHQGGKIKGKKERQTFLTWLDKVEHGVFKIPRPDLIIYLDVPPEESQKLLKDRASKHGNKDGLEKMEHQIDAHEQSLRLVASMNNWHRINCIQDKKLLSIERIHEKIWESVRHML